MSIDHKIMSYIKKYKVNQGCMSLSPYYLEDGRHLAQLHRHRRHCRAYVPTSYTASHDNHEKINLWVSFSFLYGYGAPLGGSLGRWSWAKNVYALVARELWAECSIEKFQFIVSELVQVSPDNSLTECVNI